MELGRAGLLTTVQPPTLEDEAVRDLARARDDAREDLQRCRHRLGKLLLRRGRHYAGRNWTRAHRQWVDGLVWTHAAERAQAAAMFALKRKSGHTECSIRCSAFEMRMHTMFVAPTDGRF